MDGEEAPHQPLKGPMVYGRAEDAEIFRRYRLIELNCPDVSGSSWERDFLCLKSVCLH